MHRALICCDASLEIGFGHLYRCLAVADSFLKDRGIMVSLAMAEGPVAFRLVRQAGYPLHLWDRNRFADRESWLLDVIRKEKIDLLFLDLREDLDPEVLRALQQSGCLLASMDDLTSNRLHMDFVFQPPVFAGDEQPWEGFDGKLLSGWEWVALRRPFSRSLTRKPNRPPAILVTMGGSDPAGMTEIAVEALCLAGSGFQADILLGPGFSREEALRKYLQQEAVFPYRIHRSAEAGEIARLMAASDMALASFGMTAYELAAMRVPALYLCLSPLHERRAIGFQKQGLAVNLGLYQKNRRECLAVEIRLILDDEKRRWAMMESAAQLQVGSGAERIADLLSTEIGRRRRNSGD